MARKIYWAPAGNLPEDYPLEQPLVKGISVLAIANLISVLALAANRVALPE
jgi:hypothetical protein